MLKFPSSDYTYRYRDGKSNFLAARISFPTLVVTSKSPSDDKRKLQRLDEL